MGSQTYIYSFVTYFLLITTFVGVLSQGGLFNDSDVSVTVPSDIHSFQTNGTNINTTIPASTSVWGIGNVLKDVFGFFVFGLDLGLGSWNWVVRLIFVYLPLLFFGLGIYFAVRSGS